MNAAKQKIDQNVILPPLRQDLIVTQQKYEGRTFYVIKDPISLQYFRMTAEDFFLSSLFDGRRNFREIKEVYAGRFPHLRLEMTGEELDERILRFANDLALLQFLQVQGQRLKQRVQAARARAGKTGFSGVISKLFFSRFSLFDPDQLFARMARPVSWIWTRLSLWLSLALIAAALVVFFRSYERIAPSMGNFFSLHNLFLVWVITILIKSVHELGHGLTCKHFGGEVHEVGIMLLVFTPYFFVNVTDSWVMPNRNRRILISAAGIFVELVLAALATLAWSIVQPGQLQQLLYNVMVIASISTIVFNANPLMRFDGYYIMTDLLEIPNLSSKSKVFVGQQVKKLLFGPGGDERAMARLPLPSRRFGLFYCYAVASFFYGYFVIYKLTRYMSAKLAPYGLETLGTYLSISALLAWVILPFWNFFKGLNLNRSDWSAGGRLRRIATLGGIWLVFIAVISLFPRSLTIKRAVAVELAQPEIIRPEVGGFVKEIYVKEGQRVAAGAAIARMANREIGQQVSASGYRLAIAEAMTSRAIATDRPSEIKQSNAVRIQQKRIHDEAVENDENLILRATADGTVLTHDLEAKSGRYLKAGETFCELARLDAMRIKIPLSEKQVRHVKKGQQVALKAYAYPGKLLHGLIVDDPILLIGREMSPALSARRDGDVPTGLDREGHEVPLERTFEAEVEVHNPDGILRQGMTGRAAIYTGNYRFGSLMLQSLRDLISLDYRF
jgi:putative peptide zinc metalloprotease protein